MNKVTGIFNERNAIYNVCFNNGGIAISDTLGNPIDSITAIKLGERIIDCYSPDCFVYVGIRDVFLKVGLSANLERRDHELDKLEFQDSTARYKRELHLRCQGRSEAAALEKSILEFLNCIRQPAGSVIGTEWFFYKEHDFVLINSVFESSDPENATKFFKQSRDNYVWLKKRYSAQNKSYELIDFINRHPVIAFRKHAFIEFEFLPQP